MTIWKYPVPVVDQFAMRMPVRSRFLSVQTQRGQPEMWWLVHPDSPSTMKRFRCYGTGHAIDRAPPSLTFLGTFQIDGGNVFHLFEEDERPE